MKTMNVKQFAKVIGVCRATVFNYQKRGILGDRRNPINNYRIFTVHDVKKVMSLIKNKQKCDEIYENYLALK